ncbi:ATP-binding cassette, subfamily B, RaxB [Roseateles sp. YR242]|uniref:peptidase domain-containing ABC transporter n=1 Tax=Roseateles sp. YR242 TaxID=1855305 RepID=UPI0008CF368A|nr:peptidase domain-containing ABC transporter [Roseateles sp. YR242]SEL55267.1 ATP-binding cassette, subfamily B, RaxB [Roseateles sp. YR242]
MGFLQSEAAECGVACLATIAEHHNLPITLTELRSRFSVGLKGATLDQLSDFATEIGFHPRAVRLEVEEVPQLSVPCVLHWGMSHFVVLLSSSPKRARIFDPAIGERRLSQKQLSEGFTGVALELSPAKVFSRRREVPKVTLRDLTGRVTGLYRSLGQLFLAAFVLQIFAVLSPILNQIIIDDAVNSGDTSALQVLTAGLLLILLTQTLVSSIRSWLSLILGQSMSLQWTSNVFAHLVKLPMRYFETRHLGDVTSRFSSINAIQQTITHSAVEAVLDGLMALIALILMFTYSAKLAGVVVAASLLFGIFKLIGFRISRPISGEKVLLSAKEQTHFLETLRAIQPLKLFNRHEQRRARWQNLMVAVFNKDVTLAKIDISFNAAQSLVFGVENIVVFYMGASMIMSPSEGSLFTIGMLMAFLSFKGQYTGRISNLVNFAFSVGLLNVHYDRLSDIVATPPENDKSERADLSDLQGSVELKDVWFRFSPRERWVLQGVNLKIEQGDALAIAGASGGGKTTLLKLILGIHRPVEGQVLISGIPLETLGYDNARRMMAAVMQDDSLLAGTILDNVTFFSERPDRARAQWACKVAQVHGEIIQMPMGYNSLIGDLGTGLSGGQRQRIVLARALYQDVKILIMDEATSHLDVDNERKLSAELRKLQITRIVVAHRPETIASVGTVINLIGGRVEAVQTDPVGSIRGIDFASSAA